MRSPRGDRFVILSYPAACDLHRDEPLEIADGHRLAPFAQRAAHALDDFDCALADRFNRIDLPRIFSFARELQQIVAAAMYDPAARRHRVGDAEVEVDREIARS